MDMDSAIELVSKSSFSPMTKDENFNRLAEQHAGEPQRARLAMDSLSAIYEGIAGLNRLGHNFFLTEGLKAPPVEFPKMLYKDGCQPIIVQSQEEADELPFGWRGSPAVASEAEAALNEPAEAVEDPTQQE